MRVAAAALAGLSLATVATGAAEAGNGKPPSGSSTGTGQVFFPNPVASLQSQSLTDQNDADYAAFTRALVARYGPVVWHTARVIDRTGLPHRDVACPGCCRCCCLHRHS